MREHNQSPPSHLRWGRGGREGAKSLKNLRVKKFQPNIIFQLKPCSNTLLWWAVDYADDDDNNDDNYDDDRKEKEALPAVIWKLSLTYVLTIYLDNEN